MRDDQRGPAGQDGTQRRLHHALTRNVQQRRRLVEHEDRRGGQEGAGEGDQLPLPGGQATASFAYLRVIAAGQRADEGVRADSGCGRFDVSLAGARLAEPHVVRDGAAEQEVLLGDQHDLVAQRLIGQCAEIGAIEEHPALAGVVEPGQEPGDSGLPGAGRADQGHRLAGRDGQVEPGEHGGFPVAEPH